MKKVITYGTFDLFHFGHLELLRRAKALGEYLIVAISTDEFNMVKGKKCVINEIERLEIVKANKYVDEVIWETSWEQKESDIKTRHIDVFVMGDDWQGKFDFLKMYCEVVYLPRTENISSSEIKKSLSQVNNFRGINFEERFNNYNLNKTDQY